MSYSAWLRVKKRVNKVIAARQAQSSFAVEAISRERAIRLPFGKRQPNCTAPSDDTSASLRVLVRPLFGRCSELSLSAADVAIHAVRLRTVLFRWGTGR